MTQTLLQPEIDRLKTLYEQGEHVRVVREATEWLIFRPKNRKLRRLIKKANWHLNYGEYKVALSFVCLAMLALTFGFVQAHRQLQSELKLKDMQINSLIDEVGVIQEENREQGLDLQSYHKNMTSLSSGWKKMQVILSEVGQVVKDEQKIKEAEKQLQALSVEPEEKSTVKSEVIKAGKPVKTKYPDNILDVLILGTHGTLTDTIIVLSVNPALATVTLVSVPRDFYYNGRKINEYYNKFGIGNLETVIADITGVYPDKYVVFDLQGFVSAVDVLGGIDVQVEKAIYDTLYPGPNFTYQTYSIEAGAHHLSGEEALKYARSRKSTTDWDRSKRQQQVIAAVKEKVKGLGLFSSTEKCLEIYSALSKAIKTDIGLSDGVFYLKKYGDYRLETGNTIDTGNFMYSTYNQRGQYILLPNSGDYGEIWNWVEGLVLR